MKHFALALAAALLAAGLLTPPLLAQAQTIDAGAVVKERCTVCHDTKRICRMLGARDRQGWFETATRMVKNGARVNPAEVEAVASHLAKLPKGDPSLCK